MSKILKRKKERKISYGVINQEGFKSVGNFLISKNGEFPIPKKNVKKCWKLCNQFARVTETIDVASFIYSKLK